MLSLLSSFIWLPVIGAMALLIFGDNAHASRIRFAALSLSVVLLGLSAYLYMQFDPTQAGMQFVEQYSWIDVLGIQYALGVDGISMPLIVLTAYTHVLVVLAVAFDSCAPKTVLCYFFVDSGIY